MYLYTNNYSLSVKYHINKCQFHFFIYNKMPAITSSAVCLGSASSSVGSLLHRSSNGSISSSHIDKDSYMKRNISNSYDSIENFSSSSSPLDELLNDDESCELDKNEIRKILTLQSIRT